MKCNFATLRVVMATFFLTFSCLPVQAVTSGAVTADDSIMGSNAVAAGKEWTVSKTAKGPKKGDFKTIQEAINSPSVLPGDTIVVSTGLFDGAKVTKNVIIKGSTLKNGKPGTTIKNPAADVGIHAGFVFPGQGLGSGATITGLVFHKTLEFPVFSRGADNVTVTGNIMTKPVQGITNINGSNWSITQNIITDLEAKNGGGMGIFIGTDNKTISHADNNTISHNTIAGTMTVNKKDPVQYMGAAIGLATNVVLSVGDAAEIDQVNGILASTDEVLASPAVNATDNATVAGNKIDNNTISVESQRPDLVDIAAIVMYELGNVTGTPTCNINNNTIITGPLVTTATVLAEGPDGLTIGCNNQADVVAIPALYGVKPLP